jgi:gliding motility-associated-like protein
VNKFILILIFIAYAGYTSCQTSFTWYFGNQAGIKFNPGGSTTPQAGSVMNAGEGCTVVSDTAGIVMFYSDGISLWNNSSPTPVCTCLPGGSSSTQAALAIPVPGSECQKFLIFTTNGAENAGTHDLGVALISVTGTAPGYIVSVSQPPLSVIQPPGSVFFSEKLSATPDSTGGYWVVGHDYSPGPGTANTFFKYHITATAFSSLSTTAQVQAVLSFVQQTQSIGSNHFNPTPPNFNAQGQMKFSKTGQKLGLVLAGSKTIDLFQFNLTTGNLTLLATTNVSGSTGNLYGCEFSPNGNLLYTSESFGQTTATIRKLYQWNISNGSLSSPYIVTSGSNIYNNRYKYNALQLGPNDKIYCSEEMGIPYLSVIQNPNIPGSGCSWSSMTEPIAGTNLNGLPVVMVNYGCGCPVSQAIISGPTPVCAGTSVNEYSTQPGMTNYSWTVSPGGTITAGAGTSTVTVNWITAGVQNVTVTFTNSLGCRQASPTIYPVTVNASPEPFLSGPVSVCVNSPGNSYVTEAGMSNYLWNVSAGGITISGGTVSDSTVLVLWNTAGMQSVSVSYTDTNGCPAADPALLNVTVDPLPVPVITGPTSSCVNSSYSTYTTQAGMSNYQWYVSAGGVIISGGTTTDSTVAVVWDSAGIQSVTVSYTDTNGCQAPNPALLNVTVNPLPVPAISGPVSPCILSSGNIYITEPGMNSYAWNISPGGMITGGQGTNTINVNWNSLGPQEVSVGYADTNGCMTATPAIYPVNVIPYPDSAGNIQGPTPVCAGTSGLVYTVVPIGYASGYSWTLPQGFSIVSGDSTNSVTVDVADTAVSGMISVFGTNSCGNGIPSPAFYVIINFQATADAGPDQVTCEGIPFTVSQASAGNYLSLQWFSDGTGTLANGNTLTPTYSPGVSDTATVIMKLVAYGEFPCMNDTSGLNLEFIPGVSVNAGEEITACDTTPVLISGSVASHSASVFWTTSGNGTFNDPGLLHPYYTPSHSDVAAGHVIITLHGNAFPPCIPDSDYTALNLISPVKVFAGPDTGICAGRQLSLDRALAENYNSVEWTTGGDGAFTDKYAVNTFYHPGMGDQAAGKIMLILTATGIFPCGAGADTLNLLLDKGADNSPGSDGMICQGMPYTVQGVKIDHYSGFTWETDGQGTLENTNMITPTYISTPDETGIVHLTLWVSGLSACKDSTYSSRSAIYIYSEPEVETGAGQTVKYDSSTILTCIVSGGSGSFSFLWHPSSLLTDSTAKDPQTVDLLSDTIFIVTATDNITGCFAIDSVRVKVSPEEGDEKCIVIYNVITPNGDGVNDTWIIDCIELFPKNKVEIFNRWGDLVNSFQNYNNADVVWKGTNKNGEPLPDGTYFYILNIRNGSTFKGWVYVRSAR